MLSSISAAPAAANGAADNFAYLFVAYTLIWLVLLGFVLAMFYRQRGIKRELESLRKILQEKEEE